MTLNYSFNKAIEIGQENRFRVLSVVAIAGFDSLLSTQQRKTNASRRFD